LDIADVQNNVPTLIMLLHSSFCIYVLFYLKACFIITWWFWYRFGSVWLWSCSFSD